MTDPLPCPPGFGTGDIDGEGWGKWDGVPLPRWLRNQLAPYTAQVRERRLQEILDALSAPPASPVDREVVTGRL